MVRYGPRLALGAVTVMVDSLLDARYSSESTGTHRLLAAASESVFRAGVGAAESVAADPRLGASAKILHS